MTRLVQVSILLAWTFIASAQTRLDTLNTLRPQASANELVMIESEMAALIARAAPDSALALANQALTQASTLADDGLLGYARYQLGMVHYVRAEYEQAIAIYMQAIPLLQADSLALSYAYNRLGNAYQRGGRIDEARTAFAEAVRQLEQRGDLSGAAYAHTNLGLLNWRTGDYEEALPHYLRSLEIRRQLGDSLRTASTLNNIGILYYQWAAYEPALDYYLQSLAIREEIGDPIGIARVLNNIGKTYQDLGDTERAMESFAEALTRCEKLDEAAVRGYTLHNIGTVHQQRGAYEEAQTHFEHALATYRSVDDAGGITLVLNATGKLHNVRGRYTDARAALDSALTLATHFSNQEGQARALMHLGGTYVGLGENERAQTNYERALDISTNIRQRELSKDLYAHLSELHLQKGDHQRALALYKQYDSLQDSLFTDRANRRLTEMRTRYHSERKERENIALRHESGQQQVTIDRQQLVAVLGGIVLLLVLASLALLYRTQRSTARHNYQLGEVNQTLEENNARLEQALDQVQTLSGLIPICANCKNIRDDEGYWERLETYLLKRSDAQFTHSICPNCVRELYPDYADEINTDPPES